MKRGNAETNELNCKLRQKLQQQQSKWKEELESQSGPGGEVYLFTPKPAEYLDLFRGRRLVGQRIGRGGHSFSFVRLGCSGLSNSQVTEVDYHCFCSCLK